MLERDDFAKRMAAAEPISHARAPVPGAAGLRLGGDRGRRRARRHRPDLQPAHGPRDADGVRAAAAGRPDRAAAARASTACRRCRSRSATRSGSPSRRARCTARRCGSRTRRCASGTTCCSARRSRRTWARATRSARSRARSWRASTARRPRREAEAGFDRVFIAHELPAEIEEAALAGRRRDVHLPELIVVAVRRLALGGAAQARPGRREARRRAAGGRSAGRARGRRWTGACCSWASASSAACGRLSANSADP